MDHTRHLDLISGRRRGVGATLARAALRLASWPYAWAMTLRNLGFDRGWRAAHRVAVPVISVGNLTVGGTGKTPLVEYVARRARERDVAAAILSRGYGGVDGPNDEARVLEEHLPDVPHLQGPDRVELAVAAIEELESELLILDDGFQHRRLARDLDLVAVDATNPWGYGSVLPRGLLREPIRGLRRASAVILTRCDQVDAAASTAIEEQVRRIAPQAPVVHSVHRSVAWRDHAGRESALDALPGSRVAAFCGIGNPAAFRTTLEHLGLSIVAWRQFPDHHCYQRSDVEALEDWTAALACDAVVTTEKDLVKLRLERLRRTPVYALRIALQPTRGAEVLQQLLERVLPT